MDYETILVDTDARVATVTVNRPEKRNALNSTVRRELMDALASIEHDEDVGVVVITGAGDKAFIAGADIGEFAERTPIQQRAAMEPPSLFERVGTFPKPVIASINGYCLGGGCELALACDLRIAGRSARLGQPEIKLGILPGGGGTQRLPRLVGFGAAMRMILTGEMVGAEEAERMGLVDVVVDDDALATRTRELAGSIAAHSPVALRLAKEGVRASMEMPLTAGLRFERELFVTAFSSQDKEEGVAAFLEKRAPEWRGR